MVIKDGLALMLGSKVHLKTGRSSLIGVAISLTGNILISLALNCQKLAHLRLQNQARSSGKNSTPPSPHSNGDDEEPNESTLLNSKKPVRYDQDLGEGARNEEREEREEAESPDENGEEENGTESNKISTDYLYSRLWWLGLALMSLGELGNFLCELTGDKHRGHVLYKSFIVKAYGFAPASLVAPLGAVALLSNVVFAPILLRERFRPSDIGGILLAIIGAVTVVFSSKQSDNILDPGQLLQAVSRIEFIAYCIVTSSLTLLLIWASFTNLGDRFIYVDIGVCALFGGFTVLSTKGVSSLLSLGKPLELIRFPITYALLAILVSTALGQVTFLNRALQRFDSREVIPTQFVSFTISAIVGSAILYQDFADMDANQLINFLFGCLTTFAGVLLLTNKNDEQRGQGQQDVEGSNLEASQASNVGGQSAMSKQTSKRVDRTELIAHPIAVPRTHPAAANFAGRSGKRRATAKPLTLTLTAGSVPPFATQDHGTANCPQSSSLNDFRNTHFVSARRSIFNPAFTIAYIDASRAQQLPR